jgi:GTP cyclohydrolase I
MTAAAAPQVIREAAGLDPEAAERAVRGFGRALGMALGAGGVRDAPGAYGLGPRRTPYRAPFPAGRVPRRGGYSEFVLARDVPVRPVGRHHVRPFTGVAHIGCLPCARIPGQPALARAVEDFACRPRGAGAAPPATVPARVRGHWT